MPPVSAAVDDASSIEDAAKSREGLPMGSEPPPPTDPVPKYPQLSSVILPESMRPGLTQILKSIEETDGINEDDVLSIIFIIRIIDALHFCFYATFLSISLADILKKALDVPQLDLEAIEVYGTRWSWNGQAPVSHHINWDFDMAGSYDLHEIARRVLEKEITPKEGLMEIHDYEVNNRFGSFENFYRNMPGRILVLTVMSGSAAFSFFKGTWIDVGFASITGFVCGLILYGAAQGNQLIAKTIDMLVSISAGMIATIGMTILPDGTCFSAEVLGTLCWFLYGVAFFISLSEIYNGQLVCGVTRLALALTNTFGLAYGTSLGLWIAAYGGENRYELAQRDCSDAPDYQISDVYLLLFYPLLQITALMQIRVKLRHWPVALLTQAVAVVAQYFIGTYWEQPAFATNLIPAYLATIAAKLFIAIGTKLNLTGIKTWSGEILGSGEILEKAIPNQIVDETGKTVKTLGKVWKSPVANTFRFQEMIKSNLHNSYLQTGTIQNKHSTLWFCILPAIYLLVPGSSLFRDSFRAFWGDTSSSDQGDSTGAMVSIFIIGFSQAVGVRLAMATLDALDRNIFDPWLERRKQR